MNENWKTSSYSGGNGGNCVEALSDWHTSSYSGEIEDCVETRTGRRTVQVRDTKDRGRGIIAVGGKAWEAFLGAGGGDSQTPGGETAPWWMPTMEDAA